MNVSGCEKVRGVRAKVVGLSVICDSSKGKANYCSR